MDTKIVTYLVISVLVSLILIRVLSMQYGKWSVSGTNEPDC